MASNESCNIVLYSYFRSSCSWRLRALLAYKGLSYKYEPVNLLKFEHKQDKFIRINPKGEVPTLVYNGHTMSQSASIMDFIEEMSAGAKPTLPADLVERQLVREVCNIIGTFIQPLQNPFLAGKIAKKYLDDADKQNAFKKDWPKSVIEDGFSAVEVILAKHAGKYCFGDAITMADFYLVPQVFNADRFNVDMAYYPVITRVNNNLLQLDCFKVSHPSNQPDFPPPQN